MEQHIQVSCDIAAGRTPADPNAKGQRLRAAHKDLNAKGNGPWWFRMVYRNGDWQYFSEDRLPTGTFLASDRRATVYGDVFAGELVCNHSKAGPVEQMWLACPSDTDSKTLVELSYRKRRDGQLVVTLPDATELVVSNPRK